MVTTPILSNHLPHSRDILTSISYTCGFSIFNLQIKRERERQNERGRERDRVNGNRDTNTKTPWLLARQARYSTSNLQFRSLLSIHLFTPFQFTATSSPTNSPVSPGRWAVHNGMSLQIQPPAPSPATHLQNLRGVQPTEPESVLFGAVFVSSCWWEGTLQQNLVFDDMPCG